MTEDKVRFYSANVVAGLDALHAHSIAYRDLKPENMVGSVQNHLYPETIFSVVVMNIT